MDIHSCVSQSAAMIQGLDFISQMTCKERDIGKPVASKLIQRDVEKPHTRRDLEERFGSMCRNRS